LPALSARLEQEADGLLTRAVLGQEGPRHPVGGLVELRVGHLLGSGLHGKSLRVPEGLLLKPLWDGSLDLGPVEFDEVVVGLHAAPRHRCSPEPSIANRTYDDAHLAPRLSTPTE